MALASTEISQIFRVQIYCDVCSTPKLYALELIPPISKYHIERHGYILSILFAVRPNQMKPILESYPEMTLQDLHQKARERYQNIRSKI